MCARTPTDRREIESLKAFVEYWGEERSKAIKAVRMDMLPGYERAVRECVPHAVIVFDKFHIAQQLMRAVDTVRKDETRRLAEQEIDVLKKTK